MAIQLEIPFNWDEVEEEWKDIVGYEGLYQISSLGRVKSLNYRKSGEEGIRKPIKDKDGYITIMLYKNRNKKIFKVHRLVASAFIPNPNNLPQVNHLDENKLNNCATNLEFCDAKYNLNFGTRNERVARANSKSVNQYSLSGDFIKQYPSAQQVQRELGFDNSHISRCCRGELKTAYKFKWEYE